MKYCFWVCQRYIWLTASLIASKIVNLILDAMTAAWSSSFGMVSEFCLIGASLNFLKIKPHFTFSSCACLKYGTAPYALSEASAKTCNWGPCSFVKSISYHLGISIDGKSCNVFFYSSQRCFNSDGNSSSQSTLRLHNSWMFNFGSSVDGAIIGIKYWIDGT